ncbi:uncharacterized protein [Parasteatoda tepidariorum]|uniref:uncharacterized protein n=1 Tax=Parasteatoda tepidariorum TaxID=114398 RepID=UPI001C729C2B|nr:uncharacterized protein LOC107437369 [Parasteatoda tepidariorum]XP_015904838.2 uncharacterized protein LOC107437369 [Parasteatoda tepidariorum]
MKYPSDDKDSHDMEKSVSGPTVVLLWVWNWFATLPKTVTNMFADFKSGEFLSKFSMLDAMMQFLVAVATSCHPQEDGFDGEEVKSEKSTPIKAANGGDLKIFAGPGRTLRPRTVAAES